jgi:hypothetical protein
MSSFFELWAIALTLTLAIEAPLILRLFKDAPLKNRIAAIFIANSLSHPILWFVLTALPIRTYGLWLSTAEAIVYCIECALYAALLSRWLPFKRIATSTALANVASCAAGVLISAFR